MRRVASIRRTSYLRAVPLSVRLGHRDYDAALGLVAEAAGTSGAQPFELPAVEGLLRLIPADRAGYFEYGDGGLAFGTANTFFVDHPFVCDQFDWDSDAVRAAVGSWPLRDCCSAGVPDGPRRLSDFLVGRRLRRNAWYAEVMRPWGVEHEMKVWLTAPRGIARGFFLVRGPRAPDFDERDRAVLELLRPHLARIRARWESRHRPSVLTKREAEVCGLVAEGLTNAEIASRLFLAPTTVRTHLENVFAKLGVHTRTAAVARLREVAALDPRAA
jgi:DNA-binding CsgD family transcriptional regulator